MTTNSLRSCIAAMLASALTLSSLVAFGQVPGKPKDDPANQVMNQPLLKNHEDNLPAWTLYQGLLAEPGTQARKDAADILEAQLNKAYEGMTPDAAYGLEQKLSKNIFNLTVEYLRSGEQCDPKDKVRIYRSIGTQPLVRRPGTVIGGFNIMMDPMKDIIQALIVGGVASQENNMGSTVSGYDMGELAYMHLEEIAKQLTRPTDWNKLFLTRHGTGGKINLKWIDLGSNHTGTSEDSPLISTSIDQYTVQMWGKTIMTMDVCPERVLPSIQKQRGFPFMGETEFYLPLFTLPEENVRMVGIECATPDETGKIGWNKPGCGYSGESEFGLPKVIDPDKPETISPATQKMRRLFTFTGHPFESIFTSQLLYQAQENAAEFKKIGWNYTQKQKERYGKMQDGYYYLMKQKSGSLAEWRKGFREFPASVDCVAAQKIIDTSKVGLLQMRSQKKQSWESQAEFDQRQKKYVGLKAQLEGFTGAMKKECAKAVPPISFGAALPPK